MNYNCGFGRTEYGHINIRLDTSPGSNIDHIAFSSQKFWQRVLDHHHHPLHIGVKYFLEILTSDVKFVFVYERDAGVVYEYIKFTEFFDSLINQILAICLLRHISTHKFGTNLLGNSFTFLNTW